MGLQGRLLRDVMVETDCSDDVLWRWTTGPQMNTGGCWKLQKARKGFSVQGLQKETALRRP